MAKSTNRDEPCSSAGRSRIALRRCVVPLCAVAGMTFGVLTALSAWAVARLEADEMLLGTMLGAIMGAGLGTAAGLVASVLVDPRELDRLCTLCRRPIGGGDCPDCGRDQT
jgi:malonyl CoA-acyl carrier protein transacylase